MKLHIGTTPRGTEFTLPLDYVTQSAAVLAKRGAGKTYTTDVIVEELMECGQVPIIIDPTGAHWGLKSSADGKKPGYPVYVFGGDHADLPLEETSGEIIAQSLVANPFPSVIDTSLLRKCATNRFLGQFFETLYRLNRVPLHLICDECDLYAPQRPFGDEARTLGAMEDIVRRGRIKGIGCTLVSQRPAVVNKNVLTQCEMLFTMRLVHPKDIDAVKEWVAVHGDLDTAKQMISDLPALPIGTVWIWCPGWGDIFERVKIRARRTFDSSATPKPGQVMVKPKEFAEVDVKKLGAQIIATVERAKADDPRALRAEIARLKKAVPLVTETKEVRVEVPVLHPLEVESINHDLKQCALTLKDVGDMFERLVARFKPSHAPNNSHPVATTGQLKRTDRLTEGGVQTRTSATRPEPGNDGNGTLSGAERKVLTVLAQHPEGCEKGKLALLSGYTYSGGFRNILSSLRSLSFIRGMNEQTMTITELGAEALGPYDPLPTGSELAHYWLTSGKLSNAEASVLRVLIEQGRLAGMTATELAEAAGYEYSGGFRNILSTLRTAGVISGKNTDVLKASENLFD